MDAMTEWNRYDLAIVFVLLPLFVYILFRAAALGWYRTKDEFQRRFVSDIRKEGKLNGQ